MDRKGIMCEDVVWIHVTQDRVQWRAVLNTVMKVLLLDQRLHCTWPNSQNVSICVLTLENISLPDYHSSCDMILTGNFVNFKFFIIMQFFLVFKHYAMKAFVGKEVWYSFTHYLPLH